MADKIFWSVWLLSMWVAGMSAAAIAFAMWWPAGVAIGLVVTTLIVSGFFAVL